MKLMNNVLRELKIMNNMMSICWVLVGLQILFVRNTKNQHRQYYQVYYRNLSNTKNLKSVVNSYKK
jgi:hypothetical protein